MLLARTLRWVCRPSVRFYGFEEPGDRTGALFYHYGESQNTSDRKTPDKLGYSISPHDQELDRNWARPTRVTAVTEINEGGTDTTEILNSELNNNPLGDYDEHDKAMPKHEVKTRMIHVLRHFEKIDLKKLDWDAHLEDGLKLDSLERVALLTSIETEFNTIFEDNVFDHIKTLNHVVKQLVSDRFVL